ncbi:cell division ATP-binding protein FtsE [Ectothiorhodospiraceae bacterium BW-2]|nr:cell division ATP-binding protein FtsE [Ectothiorhodospiraceae bacterium BW-2]
MINFTNVSKRYPNGFEALNGISFHIPAGTMAFITGHSGAGKSTLMRLIALIERPTSGQIVVDNHNLSQLKRKALPYHRRKLGMIFQDHRLLFGHTVYDNVALPLMIAGYDPNDMTRLVRAALDKVGLLSKENAYPITLSGGEQQRVGIARAVIHKPLILMADEPTGNLDPDLSRDIMQLFVDFNRIGVTVLIASHDTQLINQFQFPVLTLERGRLRHSSLAGAT